MVEAGVYELRYGGHDGDERHLVRSLYLAMELERLEMLR